MAILVTSNKAEDPIKIEAARVATTQNNDFSNSQGCQGQLKFEPIRDIMVVLVTCNNEEDPMKNKGTRVATISLWGFFQTLKGS